MKYLCIFLFVFNFGLNAAVHSQNQRVSIELKNASIEDLIGAIKSQCDMGFLYDYNKTKSVKNITVNMRNVRRLGKSVSWYRFRGGDRE